MSENWKPNICNMKFYDIDEILELVPKVFHCPLHIFDQIYLWEFVRLCEDDSHMWKQHEILSCVRGNET